MSVSKALVLLQQMERVEAASSTKRLATLMREALADVEIRLKKLEAAVATKK